MKRFYEATLNAIGYYEATPKPSEEELGAYYRDKYFQEEHGTYASSYSADDLRHFANTARVAHATGKRLNVETSLLDLGCGEGFFTEFFHSAGWTVRCCDFSAYGITRHNSDMLPFFSAGDIRQSIEDEKADGRRYGLVNLQNVLEHVIDPVALLEGIKPLLGVRSVVRIRVPNDYSEFQSELVARGDTTNTWFTPPEHLSYFNQQGLSNLLAHCGYRVASLQADFPIELFLANPHSNYWKDRSLGKGAHLTRVFCENHLIERDIEAYIDYAQAAARLGFGRQLTAYAAPLPAI